MKDTANCVNYCELQTLRSTTFWTHIAVSSFLGTTSVGGSLLNYSYCFPWKVARLIFVLGERKVGVLFSSKNTTLEYRIDNWVLTYSCYLLKCRRSCAGARWTDVNVWMDCNVHTVDSFHVCQHIAMTFSITYSWHWASRRHSMLSIRPPISRDYSLNLSI